MQSRSHSVAWSRRGRIGQAAITTNRDLIIAAAALRVRRRRRRRSGLSLDETPPVFFHLTMTPVANNTRGRRLRPQRRRRRQGSERARTDTTSEGDQRRFQGMADER